MSTRLQKAERAEQDGTLHPTKHRQIIIEERNRQIAHLKAKLRLATQLLRDVRPIVYADAESEHFLDGFGPGLDANGEPTSGRVPRPKDALLERIDLFLA